MADSSFSTEPSESRNTDETIPKSKISKNQLKKMARKEKWEKEKPMRRAQEKLKRRLKLKEAKNNGINLGSNRKKLKLNKMSESACKQRLVFDLSFDSTMTKQELSKTVKQLHRCYSVNRRALAPLQIYITGYSENSKSLFHKLGYMNWDVHFDTQPHCSVFGIEELVYLSSESPNVLEILDPNKVYVIGALVDHNRLKGLTHKQAEESNISHACLPLDKYVDLKSRKVLTIDQVYLILLEITEGKTWEEAFVNVIPKRKGVMLKNTASSSTVTDIINCESSSNSTTCCVKIAN